jgi:hypothetical protein
MYKVIIMKATGLQEFVHKPAAKAVGVGLFIVVILFSLYNLKSSLSSDETTAYSKDPWFVCAETGKTFHHALQAGDTFPVYSSASGKNTGYPAELCFWTKEGTIKKDPTPVLLNEWIHKTGPTFCPECGRLVVPHNPPAVAGHAPPTKADYSNRPSQPAAE